MIRKNQREPYHRAIQPGINAGLDSMDTSAADCTCGIPVATDG